VSPHWTRWALMFCQVIVSVTRRTSANCREASSGTGIVRRSSGSGEGLRPGAPSRCGTESSRESGHAGTCERPQRAGADLEAEPVTDVQGGRLAQVRLGYLPGHRRQGSISIVPPRSLPSHPGGRRRWERRPHGGHSVTNDPLVGPDRPVVKPDVQPARLPPLQQRELVPVCGHVAKAVQRRS